MAPPAVDPEAALGSASLFVEATESSGLDVAYDFGGSGRYSLAEVMGGGVALVDYDLDGDLDLFLPQGRRLEPAGDGVGWPTSLEAPSDRLLRNDGASGAPVWVDSTVAAGVLDSAYSFGVAVGDVDDDGAPDLYVTNWGADRLWRNEGDGSFTDATEASGLGQDGWSVSASFFDADADGLLELYVANYVDAAPADGPRCRTESGAPDYCGPLRFAARADSFYRNVGGGRFEDRSVPAGIAAAHAGRGLGVIAADLDGDSAADLYVANDSTENRLWIGDGRGRFEELALTSGTAVNLRGTAEASMGIAPADVDGDGDLDLLVTHLFAETNTLYLNDGTGLFRDASQASGLGAPSFLSTAFGAAWIDLDHDRDLDLVVANGRVRVPPDLAGGDDPFPLGQPNQIFLAAGQGFQEHLEPGWMRSEVSRGLAIGDVDGDGSQDLVVVGAGSPTRLYLSTAAKAGHWVAVRPRRRSGAVWTGARVAATTDGVRRVTWTRTDGSYASASDPSAHFGLGNAAIVDVEVEWPDGSRTRLAGLPVDRTYSLWPPTMRGGR